MNRSFNSASSGSSTRRSGHPCDLSVQGNSVARLAREPRKKPSQPPNSPLRPSKLPVDMVSELETELKKRLGPPSRPASVTSSHHPDFALDFSSMTDSSRDTDRSTTASSCDESEWSEGWTPLRPLLPPSHFTSTRMYPKHQAGNIESYRPCERVAALSCSSSQPSSRGTCTHRSGWTCQQCSRRSTNRSHADLIDVYVETVKNSDLSRFFRPCVTCNQVCCQCPPSPLALRIDLCTTCGKNYCSCREELVCVCCGVEKCSCPAEEETCERSLTVSKRNDPLNGSKVEKERNSEVSRYLLERRFSPIASPPRHLSEQNGDSGNSTLQLEDSGRDGAQSILSRQHVSLSVMQLATAAQCARILADSLESVLELAKEELADNVSPKANAEVAFNQKSLLSAISELNASDAQSAETRREEGHH